MKHTAPDPEPIGRPSLDDVKAGLVLLDEDDWTDEQVREAYHAERQAQASVCNLPPEREPWPGALATALHRRVLVNLRDDTGARVGGTDPEVRDLEEPYSKRVAGPAVAPTD